MAVIALASASGSPGVTTTALGLALLWPRPVLLVEADPTGGSGLAGGLLPWHAGVRRRAHRAGADREQPQRRARRRRPSHRGHARSRSSLALAPTLKPARCGISGRRWPRRSANWSPPGRTSSSMPAASARTGRPSHCSMLPTWRCSSAAPRCPTCPRCGRGPRRSSGPRSTGTSRRSCSSARASPTALATSSGS